MSRKGHKIDAIAINTRYPRQLHQKLIESKGKKSLNTRVMELLIKALEAEEAQKETVVVEK